MSENHSTAKPAISGVECGMIMMAAGVLIAPGVHALAKGLGDTIAPGQIAFARFFIQFLLLLPVVLISRRGIVPLPSLAHGVRGLLLAAATLFFFWALVYMPLADSSAIFFVEPLILTLISAFFLSEPIGVRRMIAVVIGFVGALIVIRPSFQTVGWAAMLPLLSAMFIALYLTLTRGLTKSEDARLMQFWVCLFASLILLIGMMVGSKAELAVLRPSWPSATEYWLLASLGLIAMISHMLAINAIRLAPAGVLAPLQYLEILGASLLGVAFFGDLPDVTTLLGISIVVAAGLYVFRRERLATR